MANVIQFSLKAVDQFSGPLGKVSSGLGSVVKTSAKFATGIAAAATAAVGFVAVNANIQDKVQKMSDRLGISVEQLSRFQHAADLSGVKSEQLSLAMQRMTRRIAEAAGGTGELLPALKELGINAEELGKKTPDEQMLVLADSFGKLDSQSDKVRLAFKAFDSEGVSLIQMLGNGREAVQGMLDESDRLGRTFDGNATKNAAAFNDMMTRVTASVGGASRTLANEFTPFLTTAGNALAETVAKNRDKIVAFALDAVKGFITIGVTVFQMVQGVRKKLEDMTDVEIFKSFLVGVTDVFKRILSNAVPLFTAVGYVIVTALKEAFLTVVDLAKWAWDNVKAIFSDDEASNFTDVLAQSMARTAKAMTGSVTSAFSTISTVISGGVSEVANGVEQAFGVSAETVDKQVNSIIKSLSKGIAATETAAQQMAVNGAAITGQQIAQAETAFKAVQDSLFKEEQAINDSYRQRAMAVAEAYKAGIIPALKDAQAIMLQLEQQHAEQVAELDYKTSNDRVSAISQMFGNLASLQSSHSKKQFERGKKAAIAQAIIDTAQMAVSAYKALAGIPYVGPVLGIAAAAAATVYGRQRIAQIKAQEFQGAAAGGMNTVPDTGTFLIHKGERIVQPKANQDLTEFLKQQRGQNGNVSNTFNLTISKMSILENATSVDAFMSLSNEEIERLLANKLFPAFNRLFAMGIVPKGAR